MSEGTGTPVDGQDGQDGPVEAAGEVAGGVRDIALKAIDELQDVKNKVLELGTGVANFSVELANDINEQLDVIIDAIQGVVD